MVIDKKFIKKLRRTYHLDIDELLGAYLINEYGEEEFPYPLEERDLYEHSYKLLQAYNANMLDVSLRSKEEILREKYEFLKSEYADLFSDFNDLNQQLSKNRSINDIDF